MREKLTESKLLTRLFFKLLPFQVLMIVISAVNGIVDSVYASNAIGKPAMSAIGLYGPLNHFLYAASIMFVGGSQILYGRYLTKDRKHINGIFSITIVISSILSMFTVAVMVLGAVTNATSVFATDPEDLKCFNEYLIGQSFGIVALVVGQQLFAFLSLENQTKRTMVASISCFVANAVLNHLFVVILSMGTFGLGLSSALSTWVFFGVMAIYYITGKSQWHFSFKSIVWKESFEILKLGYSGALSRFVEVFRCLIVNFLILKYVGSVGISSFAASNSFLAVIWAIPFGMVAVARMFFSISVGNRDRKTLVDEMRIVLTKGMLLQICIVILLIVFAEPLTNMFYHDPSQPIYHMTVMGFRILPLCMPLAVISLTFACYAQTMQKKAMSVILPIVDGMIGVTICSFILIPIMKMNGLYWSNVINGVICFMVIWVCSFVVIKRVPKNLEDIMAIPEEFGATDNERLDVTVTNMEEVVAVSQNVIEFCRNKGVDSKRTLFAGLSLEEMAGNIVTHGFSLDKKSHTVDIRVVYMDDELTLVIRDNCAEFDPSKRAKVMVMDKDGKNIGIKLVYGMAKNVDYQNLLGINVLTIKL